MVTGLILIICICWVFARTVLNSKEDNNLRTYVNYKYGISLKYNKEWEANYNYSDRYEGKDGYFQINAFNGQDMNIDEAVNLEATHKLMPYGSSPQISKLKIQGQEARLIMPSKDQPKDFNNQAEVIIKYPKAMVINNETYYYFVLYADKNHILEIAKTIQFLL